MQVRPIGSALARQVAEAEHYLHRKPTVSYAFGLYQDEDLVGIVTFGTPASRHLQVGACPDNPALVTELNRLWVHDRMPPNTESWFVSRALRQLPALIVVSYADTTRGHMGYVYRALNFKYAGWSDMERKTPRLDYIPVTPGAHTRGAASRSGVLKKVRRRPKVKYWTTTGNRRERAELQKTMQWPDLGWKQIPPPTEHVYHKL